jgi:hypothetical protein
MLKLNIGLSRKVGEANFSSRGASVNLELEVESGLVREPDKLHEKIRSLFSLAKRSVEEELNGQSHADQNGNGNGNGPHNGTNGNGSSTTNGRQATVSQVRAIHAIANRQKLDLAAELRSRFGVDRPDDLSLSQASELIDAIKPETNGTGGRR